jgi:hypothetical protein
MKTVKERAQKMSAVNDERQQVLPSKVIWDGNINHIEVLRKNVKCHYGQIRADYLFDSSFQDAYLDRGVEGWADFLDEVPSDFQIKMDVRALYGALLSACQSGVQQDETDGNRNVRIKRLESVMYMIFHRKL